MKTRMIPLCLLFLTAACGTKVEEVNKTGDTVEDAAPIQTVAGQASPQQALHDLYSNGKTKLIKTLDYRFEVDNVNKTTEAIEQIVKKYPAYISDSKMELENPVLENKLTIRVENEFFQDVVKEIDQLARFVNYRTITTEDVAKEFVDLESRIKTKRQVEERYAEILRSKAGTIAEVLAAEEKIGELHEEIEAAISRINYLKDQVSYSTINLEYYQKITQQIAKEDVSSTGNNFKRALSAGWNGIVGFALALAYIWPVILVAFIGGMVYRLRKRRLLVEN